MTDDVAAGILLSVRSILTMADGYDATAEALQAISDDPDDLRLAAQTRRQVVELRRVMGLVEDLLNEETQ